MASPPKRL